MARVSIAILELPSPLPGNRAESPWCFMRCHTFLPILRFPAYVPVSALAICQAFSVGSVSITIHQCVPCASCTFNTSTHGWPQFSTKRDREHTPPRPSRQWLGRRRSLGRGPAPKAHGGEHPQGLGRLGVAFLLHHHGVAGQLRRLHLGLVCEHADGLVMPLSAVFLITTRLPNARKHRVPWSRPRGAS
jgi:hypothetical protein